VLLVCVNGLLMADGQNGSPGRTRKVQFSVARTSSSADVLFLILYFTYAIP
jgi:hypothetical protein